MADAASSLVIEPGIYEHYKKKRYEVLGMCKHTETEEDMVIYKALYGDCKMWVRPFAMFVGNVDAAKSPSGEPMKRFAFISGAHSPSPSKKLAAAWREGKQPTGEAYLGVYGRLVYLIPGDDSKPGYSLDERKYLVDTHRRVAFVADGASWAKCIGDTATDILLRNGVESPFVDMMVEKGAKFKLALFDDDGTVHAGKNRF